MVLDQMKNIKNYLGINNNLDKAIEFISANSLNSLNPGKTVIDGDDVYVNVMAVNAEDKSNSAFEYHKDYFDIHIDISGDEKIDFTFSSQGFKSYEYDCGFVNGKADFSAELTGDMFVICLPCEKHRPGGTYGKNDSLYKAVFKIKK